MQIKTLKELAKDAMRAVESGYYDPSAVENELEKVVNNSLKTLGNSDGVAGAIKRAKGKAIICEVKFASPSAGEIRNQGRVSDIVHEMEVGGAVGLSVLTEFRNFHGSISNLVVARENTSLPIIMKDIVVSKEQIAAAKKMGASAVLYIEEVYSEDLAKDGLSLQQAVEFAKKQGLDTIVETHTAEGLRSIQGTDTDIIGINNRDLKTFETTIDTTLRLLRDFSLKKNSAGKQPLLMSESGYENPEDVKKIVRQLQAGGSVVPDAFLIGTSIMRSPNIKSKVQSFVEALDF
ncbi:MAG: indole-3-glycerol-phosphate synthase [Nitrososphaerales archaeon]